MEMLSFASYLYPMTINILFKYQYITQNNQRKKIILHFYQLNFALLKVCVVLE